MSTTTTMKKLMKPKLNLNPKNALAAACLCLLMSAGILCAAEPLIKVDPDDIKDAPAGVKALLENTADDVDAWRKMLELADQGDGDAQYLMGIGAARGLGPAPSMLKAESWLRKADRRGKIVATHALGEYLIRTAGEDGLKMKEGIKYLEKAAATNLLRSIHALGLLYSAGEVVKQNVETARRWLKQGADKKDPYSMYLTAMIYAGVYKGLERDDDEAMKWLKAASEESYAPADMRIAYRYEVGYGVKRDLKKALEWYENAAKAGSGEACFKIGTMYENAYGVDKDEKEAFKWFREGAEKDFAEAANKVAVCYEGAIGVEKDDKKALEYYTKAAKGGSSVGMYNLSVFYAKGSAVPRDPVESFRWMLQAANAGLAEARHEIGYRYEHGLGVERDYVAAAAWYGMAAKTNYVRSMLAMAKIYERGLGVPRNMTAASQLYNSAAKRGSVEGLTRLARIFEEGAEGVPEDLVKAYVLYCRAASKGDRPALERRDFLKRVLTKSQIEEALQIIEADKPLPSEAPKKLGSKLPGAGESKSGTPVKEEGEGKKVKESGAGTRTSAK